MAKLDELKKYKKGSQSWKKLPQATDDPSKYVGNKWENYDTPQGIGHVRKKVSEDGDLISCDQTISLRDNSVIPDEETDNRAIDISKKAPLRFVKAAAKAQAGPLSPKLVQVDESTYYVYETIRRPIYGLLTGDYEVTNRDEVVGKARVDDGVVEFLGQLDGFDQAYLGQIFSTLLHTIIKDADRINAHLSIQVIPNKMHDFKNFLERFGFRHVGDGVMKRNTGSVVPPSVILTTGLDGQE